MKKIICIGIMLMLVASVQGLIIKENTDVSLPCILIDDGDFKTQETGVGGGSVTVKYKRSTHNTWSTKNVSASGWTEIGEGVYEVDFNNTDIGSYALNNQGIFLYMVEGTGYLPYYGCAQMASISLRDDMYWQGIMSAQVDEIYGNQSNFVTADISSLATQTNLTSGVVVLTSATETQIDNIEGDTNEIQGNQSSFVTADITNLATQTNLTSGIVVLTSATETQIDSIEAQTDKIQFDSNNYTKVNVYAMQDSVITAAKIATNAFTAAKFATDCLNASMIDTTFGDEIADQILDEIMSGHTVTGSFGKVMNDIYDAIFEWGGGGW